MEGEDYNILEPKEPQVTSVIQEERILARRLRIERRECAVKRLEQIHEQVGYDPEKIGEFTLIEEEIGPVEKQAAESAAAVEHLLADADENVTNIRVASDSREVQRRFAEYQKQKEILHKLEDEATLAEQKFVEISSKWESMLELTDPLEINEEMIKQKEKCDDLIAQKNHLIDDLKKELKLADDIFYSDLKKQMGDMKEMNERIDSQVQLMKNAYRTQLALIESSIELERTTIADYNQKRWEALYKKREREEMANVEKKIKQIKEFQHRMDNLKLEHREKFRATKIQLEIEVQALQQELQHLKAMCLINSEKIDYNYQVLKRREEENLFVRSQQKRKLNKMQDFVNGLKRKIKNAQRDGTAEEIKANKEITRLQEVISDLQIKAEHFAVVNERRYQQLWRMNKEKSNNLLSQIIDMDKEINDKVLGKGSESIVVNIMKQSDLPSYRRALKKIDLKRSDSCESFLSGETAVPTDKKYLEATNNLMTHILRMIADQTGFLIEERLWPLLKKYANASSLVCKLDNVFSALEVTSEENILMLCEYFSKYAFCPTCEQEETFSQNNVQKMGQFIDKEVHLHQRESCGMMIPVPHSHVYLEPSLTRGEVTDSSSAKLLAKEMEEIMVDFNFVEAIQTVKGKKKKQLPVFCEKGHHLSISSPHTLNALQEFVANAARESEKAKKPTISKTELAISRKLTRQDVTAFWARYKEAVDPEKEKLWNGILFALNKHLPILKERQKLNEEVTRLRKQNLELKNLLRGQISPSDMSKSTFLEPIRKSDRF